MMGGPGDVDAATAAVIAAAMRRVASADGEVHPREIDLVEELERAIPPNTTVDPHLRLRGDARHVLLRSCALLALADGQVSEKELEVIHEIASAHGASWVEVEAAIVEGKRWFIRHFRGVVRFRESVVRIAQELEIDEDELETLLRDER